MHDILVTLDAMSLLFIYCFYTILKLLDLTLSTPDMYTFSESVREFPRPFNHRASLHLICRCAVPAPTDQMQKCPETKQTQKPKHKLTERAHVHWC